MTAENIWPEPNTHLYYRSVIPTLQCQLSPGKHLMISAVLGSVSANSKDLVEDLYASFNQLIVDVEDLKGTIFEDYSTSRIGFGGINRSCF